MTDEQKKQEADRIDAWHDKVWDEMWKRREAAADEWWANNITNPGVAFEDAKKLIDQLDMWTHLWVKALAKFRLDSWKFQIKEFLI